MRLNIVFLNNKLMVHIIIYFLLVVLIICLATGYCRALRAIQIEKKKVEGKSEQIDVLRDRLHEKETEFANFRRMVSERKITEDFQGLH